MSRVSALDDFEIKEEGNNLLLNFEDLAVKYGFVPKSAARYRYHLRGQREGPKELGKWKEFSSHKIKIPMSSAKLWDKKQYYVVRIQAKGLHGSYWGPSVDVLVSVPLPKRIQGIKRHYH